MNEDLSPVPFRHVMLFVADGEPNSMAAIENFRKVREAAPNYQFKVEVINVFEHYQLALEHNALITPCLVLLDPKPRAMMAGTLKDFEKVRRALRLEHREGNHG